jgi:hypothetical protein
VLRPSGKGCWGLSPQVAGQPGPAVSGQSQPARDGQVPEITDTVLLTALAT